MLPMPVGGVAIANPLINLRNVRKTAELLRRHRPDQIANALRYAYHAVRNYPTARLPYRPVCLTLFATPRCNLHCDYCQYHSPATPRGPHQAPDMTLDTLRRVLDMFPRATSVSVSGGGEPLLHPQVFDMLRVITERRMETHLVTNGTLLPGRLGDVLGTRVDFMSISFYGVDGAGFARRTGASAVLFEDMLRAVHDLARRRRPGRPRLLRASFVCTRANVDEALAFVELCAELGLDQAKLKNLTYYGVEGYAESMSLHEDDPEAHDLLARLKRMKPGIPVMLPRFYRRHYAPRRCDLPYRELVVDARGFIAPCPLAEPFPHSASIFTEADAWNGPQMRARRAALADMANPLPATCLQCEKMIQDRPGLRR
jgi:MoaA/NifB/PqqE/SkfB family radical SAM enzyme